MDFFKSMGCFEKAAFVACCPVIVPLAVLAEAYELVSGRKVFSDAKQGSSQCAPTAPRKQMSSKVFETASFYVPSIWDLPGKQTN